MEYSLQIDLAICLNTEYVWTKRTKNEECSLECSSFLLCCESVREYSLFRGPHKVFDFVGRGETYEVIVGKCLHFALITEYVLTRVPLILFSLPKAELRFSHMFPTHLFCHLHQFGG